MKDARAADRALAKGASVGPLHGVPMTVKESFNITGQPTTWGFPDFTGNVGQIQERLVLLYADTTAPTFDPWKALFWIEKSKSRTLMDMMRTSFLAVAAISEARVLVAEEQ